MSEAYPDNENVRLIFKDTYYFYLKWIAVKDKINWDLVISESHDIEIKYPFELCRKILVEIVAVIETAYMERSEGAR
jgi:hypothetical protein